MTLAAINTSSTHTKKEFQKRLLRTLSGDLVGDIGHCLRILITGRNFYKTILIIQFDNELRSDRTFNTDLALPRLWIQMILSKIEPSQH